MAKNPNRARFSSTPQPRLVPWLGLACVIVLVDQIAKIMVQRTFTYAERMNILPVFDLTLLYNKGAAFSFLAAESGWQRWVLTLLGLGAALFIIWLLARHGSQRLFAFALSLILGGALGNVIDRVLHGQVTDFFLFYWGSHYFPAFNVADSAITVGAILLMLDELVRVGKSR